MKKEVKEASGCVEEEESFIGPYCKTLRVTESWLNGKAVNPPLEPGMISNGLILELWSKIQKERLLEAL